MNQQFKNDNDGVLFKNQKRQNENSPTMKGECHTICPNCGHKSKFWLSAWTKVKRSVQEKFLTLAFTPADSQQRPAMHERQQNNDEELF